MASKRNQKALRHYNFVFVIVLETRRHKLLGESTSSWLLSSLHDTSQLSVVFFLLEHVRKQQHLLEVLNEWPSSEYDELLSSFLYLTRLFWNQIFTCFSDSLKWVAISIRRRRDRYMLAENSRSSSSSWVLVNAVRIRFELGGSRFESILVLS